jgi:protoporphyrinogen oxidase
MTRIAIIGGGFGALNLAWRLANLDSKEQLSIDIFEKEAQLGGWPVVFKRKIGLGRLKNIIITYLPKTELSKIS